MEGFANIAARSRRQALDWSLVLLSQGIEPVIESDEEGGGWRLVVPGDAYEQSLEALRLYRLENRGWSLRRPVRGQIFDGGCLAWVALITFFFCLDARLNLADTGVLDSSRLAAGQWWRLFTAMWLHADVAHFASNATVGFILLGLAMGAYGSGVGLLAAYLAGAGGNVASWLLSSGPHQSLGASGMVMGALGLLAAYAFSHHDSGKSRKIKIGGLFAGLMLFVLLGVAPETDVLAHAGGFLTGLALGLGLAVKATRLSRDRFWQALAGFSFALLTLVPWWLALAHR